MITDFPRNPLANMAGLKGFQYAPMATVLQLPPVLNDNITQPILFYGTQRLLSGYSTISMLEFNETASTDENGEVYDWVINGFVPGDGAALLPLMRNLHRNKQHIVITHDHIGLLRLVGYKAPLQFDYTYASGLAPGEDRKGYMIRFFGRGNKPAPVYSVV